MLSYWATLALLVTALTLFYTWMRHRYQHWSRRGFKFIKPLPIFGSFLPLLTQSQSIMEVVQGQYNELKEDKIGGTFQFFTPILMITDPELIKEITVKSFDHFHDRTTLSNDKVDPLFNKAVIGLKGQEWREMRNRLSPAFTASKLRGMLPLICRVGEQFSRFLTTRPDAQNSPLEFKSTFTRFTNDVIATIAFGFECNAINNLEEPFFKNGQEIVNFSGKRKLIFLGHLMVPKLMTFLNIPMIPNFVTSFFRTIIKNTKRFREENDMTRPDMLQLLMAAQKGSIEHQHGDEEHSGTIGEGEDAAKLHRQHLQPDKLSDKVITDEDITAQAFLFFFAGFETESVLLSFLAHELAVNPEIQERLREEIDSTILENDGKLTYDSVQNMKYLDMVISETLRMYPIAGALDRKCTKNYKVPGTNLTIEKGTSVSLPFFALHKDPKYFAQPERFDPERFNEENRPNIKPYTYLPFGSGPRNCIGMRFALLEAKVCAIYILATSELRVNEKTQIPIQLSRKKLQITTDNGFWLTCAPRKNPTIII